MYSKYNTKNYTNACESVDLFIAECVHELTLRDWKRNMYVSHLRIKRRRNFK